MDPRRQRAEAGIVRAATLGDELAWQQLVARFDSVLRRVAESFRLTAADVDDVVQMTWLCAFANLDRLNEPAAIRAWLVVTARRHSLALLTRTRQESLTDEPPEPTPTLGVRPLEDLALQREREDCLRGAVARLRGRGRLLLTAMLERPDLPYDELATRLEIPVGSIGPTRQRALAALRGDPLLARVAP
jgi:RNA polymerase sigma factor (sigma-70 family)